MRTYEIRYVDKDGLILRGQALDLLRAISGK